MTYEPCKWYIGPKHESSLDKFINQRSIVAPSLYCENEIQTIEVNYIQCVKLDEIEKIEPWSPSREEAIKKWATPDKLRRLRYHREEGGKRVISSEAFHDMPMLFRKYKLNQENDDQKNDEKNNQYQEKFKISDGIHRINRARELGIDCILASVEEHVVVNKNDTKNIEVI